jgi:hypothetical protein
MEELRQILLSEAKTKSVCVDGYKTIAEAKDKESLVSYFLGILDWSLERGFPSMNTVRKYFTDCEHLGIFVDKEISPDMLLINRQIYVFFHCTGLANVGFNYQSSLIPMLYFAEGCDMEVERLQERKKCELRHPAIRVPLYDFGDNKLTFRSSEKVHFIHFKSKTIID